VVRNFKKSFLWLEFKKEKIAKMHYMVINGFTMFLHREIKKILQGVNIQQLSLKLRSSNFLYKRNWVKNVFHHP